MATAVRTPPMTWSVPYELDEMLEAFTGERREELGSEPDAPEEPRITRLRGQPQREPDLEIGVLRAQGPDGHGMRMQDGRGPRRRQGRRIIVHSSKVPREPDGR